MSVADIPATGWLWFIIVVLALLNVYNLFATARKHAREEKKLRDDPMDSLKLLVTEQARMLDNDKRRLDNHDMKLEDMWRGIMANCAGVQALLDHELHDGNNDEMEQASTNLKNWLRTRPWGGDHNAI